MTARCRTRAKRLAKCRGCHATPRLPRAMVLTPLPVSAATRICQFAVPWRFVPAINSWSGKRTARDVRSASMSWGWSCRKLSARAAWTRAANASRRRLTGDTGTRRGEAVSSKRGNVGSPQASRSRSSQRSDRATECGNGTGRPVHVRWATATWIWWHAPS